MEPLLTRDALQKKLYEVLEATFELDPATLTPESRLSEDLDLDSIDLVELAMQLQDVVRKDIEIDELREVKTLNDILEALTNTNPAAGSVN